MALASRFGLEAILGSFLAGPRSSSSTAVGFGVFIPSVIVFPARLADTPPRAPVAAAGGGVCCRCDEGTPAGSRSLAPIQCTSEQRQRRRCGRASVHRGRREGARAWPRPVAPDRAEQRQHVHQSVLARAPRDRDRSATGRASLTSPGSRRPPVRPDLARNRAQVLPKLFLRGTAQNQPVVGAVDAQVRTERELRRQVWTVNRVGVLCEPEPVDSPALDVGEEEKAGPPSPARNAACTSGVDSHHDDAGVGDLELVLEPGEPAQEALLSEVVWCARRALRVTKPAAARRKGMRNVNTRRRRSPK